MNHETTIIARLDAGTLARCRWAGTDAQGRETACILAAIVPECARTGLAETCPADVMPAWLAHLTPWIDDTGSEAEWPRVVRRFAATAKNWNRLTERHEYAIRALCVREAMRHARDTEAVEACQAVALLCEQRRDGELKAPLVDAITIAWEPTRRATSWEAKLASFAVRATVAAATTATAGAAAAALAAAAASSVLAAASKAREAAADRLIDQILTVLEAA